MKRDAFHPDDLKRVRELTYLRSSTEAIPAGVKGSFP